MITYRNPLKVSAALHGILLLQNALIMKTVIVVKYGLKYINLFSKQKRRGTNLVLLSILLTTSKFEGLEKEYSITIGPCGIDESNGSGNNLFCLRNEFLQIKVFKFNPKVNCFI